MTPPVACPREVEILDLIAIDQWPARASADLRAHADTCADCTALVTVALAVTGAHDVAMPLVRVPDAAVIWHRAQLRAREEATRRATRPLLVAQVAAALLAVFGGAAWVGGLFSWLGRGLARGWSSVAATATTMTASPAPAATEPTSTLWATLQTMDPRLAAAALGTVAILSLALALSKLADRYEE